jgi:hypothetical protein
VRTDPALTPRCYALAVLEGGRALLAAGARWAGLVGALCLLGCKPEQACDGLPVGTQFTITVEGSEQYSPVDNTPCGPTFDLTAGLVLQGSVVDSVDVMGECYAGIPTFKPFGAWTWTLDQNSSHTQDNVLHGYYVATAGSCRGRVFMRLDPNGQVLTPVDGGDPNPWMLVRTFASDGDAAAGGAMCPSACQGQFPVHVQHQ